MAITSLFYTGPVTGANWGDGQLGVGERYWVADSEAAKVIPVASATRTVRVQAGRIAGGGVHDDITEYEDIVLPNPAAGTVYFTIVARRVWQTTNATTLTYEEGTTTRAIAAGLNKIPGTIDDQPLAIVAVTANNPTVSVVDDLRCIGAKGDYEATSELVLGYMAFPGYRIRINGTNWLHTMAGTWERTGGVRAGWFTEYIPQNMKDPALSTFRYHSEAIPSKPFPRLITATSYLTIEVADGGRWDAQLIRAAAGTNPNDPSVGDILASQSAWADTGDQRMSLTLTANFSQSANETDVVRVFLVHQGGSGLGVLNGSGYAMRIDWVEIQSGNNW